MILNCAWTPLELPTFLTAGRDKSVKVWQITEDKVQLKGTVTADASVTAVASSGKMISGKTWFAFGTEHGEVGIASATPDALDNTTVTMVSVDNSPAKTINQIVWRPGRNEEQVQQIAVAIDDSSVRLYNVAEGSA